MQTDDRSIISERLHEGVARIFIIVQMVIAWGISFIGAAHRRARIEPL